MVLGNLTRSFEGWKDPVNMLIFAYRFPAIRPQYLYLMCVCI